MNTEMYGYMELHNDSLIRPYWETQFNEEAFIKLYKNLVKVYSKCPI